MQRTISKTEFTQSTTNAPTKHKDQFVYAVHLYDGRIAIGQTDDFSRDVARLNSGYYNQVPQVLQVKSIIGIKDICETRSLPSVVNQFCNQFGVNRVVCV